MILEEINKQTYICNDDISFWDQTETNKYTHRENITPQKERESYPYTISTHYHYSSYDRNG